MDYLEPQVHCKGTGRRAHQFRHQLCPLRGKPWGTYSPAEAASTNSNRTLACTSGGPTPLDKVRACLLPRTQDTSPREVYTAKSKSCKPTCTHRGAKRRKPTRCKHVGRRPPAGRGSSRDVGVEHLQNDYQSSPFGGLREGIK